jgi:hypothetical protein
MKDINSFLKICPPGRIVWSKQLSSWAIEYGYFYIKNGQKQFFRREDLKNFLEKNNDDYQEYRKWRIRQNEPFTNENKEFYNFYLKWLKEQGREYILPNHNLPTNRRT